LAAAAAASAATAPAPPALPPPAAEIMLPATAPAESVPTTTPPAEPPAPALTTTPAPAAETMPAARPAFPYTARVKGDIVNIRSGPGLYYYPLQTLEDNTPVVVEGEKDGWLALRPAEGVVGLVRKSQLTVGADGASATVAAAGTRVYSSSASAKRQWNVMAVLAPGDKVQVVGPGPGEYVRIMPPPQARMWVVSDYVTAGAAATQVAQAPVTPEVPVAPIKADPFIEQYKKAEADLTGQMGKPIDQRDYAAAAAAFKEVAEKAEKDFLKRAALEQVAYIEALAAQQKDYMKVAALGQDLDERLGTIKNQWTSRQTQIEADRRADASTFIATGLVARMASLEDVDYPIKFKLVDQNNRPLAVLKSTSHDLEKVLGKVVGVRGTKTYLKEWQIYLITVDDLEVLE
jgi:SH3-like domain-containing protein